MGLGSCGGVDFFRGHIQEGHIQEEFVSPEIFWGETRTEVETDKLMLGVLGEAVSEYNEKSCSSVKIENTEVSRWINSTETDYIFSFENICVTLGIDPNYLRRGIIENIHTRSSGKKWKLNGNQRFADRIHRKGIQFVVKKGSPDIP